MRVVGVSVVPGVVIAFRVPACFWRVGGRVGVRSDASSTVLCAPGFRGVHRAVPRVGYGTKGADGGLFLFVGGVVSRFFSSEVK